MTAANAAGADRANDRPRQDPNQETSPAILADSRHADKSLATLSAQLALKGYSLYSLSDNSFLVSRWNCVRPLRDLHAVQAFARQVGAV